MGLKRGTLEGPAAKWLEVLHPLDQDRFRAALDSVLDQRRGRLVQDFRLRTPDGHFMWFALKARPVVGSDGEVSRVVGTLTDVTETKNAEERLLHDSVHDNLTGLPNRKLFIDRLGAVANFAKTMPNLRPTLMVIDLDRFKQVNDSVGIAVGNSILLTLARRLTRILKPQDTLARLAGDQFGLILMSEQDPARITAFAETIRKTIRAPIAFNDREIFLTASIGLALSDPQTQLSDEIIKDAELAMYHSKRIGGDRIDVYKPAMRARKTDRLTLESELRRAIEREEITILYQPIVRLEDRSIAGFEALARWDHPKLGRMSPVEFISIAEEIGLIVDLGMFVLDQTARQLSIWQRAMRSREPIFASVNVSSRQLLRHDLIHDIRTVLSRSSVARGTLKLELTESLVMENPEHAAQMLTRIRELGTGLSLDDFGTGHSSLAYLQRFPFDTIKIDQSFVRTTSRGTRPVILKSIIALAHDLGMDVVAEGAETDSDAVELYQLGCEYAQGFAFGEPMDADAAMRLLTEERLEAASCEIRRPAGASCALCRSITLGRHPGCRERGGISTPATIHNERLWNTGSPALAGDDAKERRSALAQATRLLHPLEPHALAVREPGRDVAAGEAGLALRHLFLRAAQRLPPRRAMRRARQRRVDDLLDLLEAQHEFGELLLLQIIAQRVVVVHVCPRWRIRYETVICGAIACAPATNR